MKALMTKYLGRVVGINLERSLHFDAAELVAAHDQYFSVRSPADGHVHHIVYTNVVQVIEDPDGVEIRHLFTATERFELVIKIGHVVTYVPA